MTWKQFTATVHLAWAIIHFVSAIVIGADWDLCEPDKCDWSLIPDEKAGPVVVAIPAQKTATCQCHGYDKGVCLCLRNGVQCHCSQTKGSVWNLNEQGQAVSKTGQYAQPAKIEPPVRVQTQYYYQQQCYGGQCQRPGLFRRLFR